MAGNNRAVAKHAAQIASYYAQLDAFERELLRETLERSAWNLTVAARSLGLSVVACELKAERLGILAARNTSLPRTPNAEQ